MKKPASPCFYIHCGNAAHNRGDRANLTSQIALLRARWPTATVVFDSELPARDRDWYDATVIKRSLLFNREQLRVLREADVILWGGGALIADNSCRLLVPYWWLKMAFIKHIMRKPVMAWAQGVIAQTALGKALGHAAFNCADVITVRDRNSLETVQALKPNETAHLTADPALLLVPSDADMGRKLLAEQGIECGKRTLIALAPTFWHLYHQPHDVLPYPMGRRFRRKHAQVEPYIEGLARLAAQYVDRFDATVLLLPRYPHEAWEDVAYLNDVAARANRPGRIIVYKGDTHKPADYYAMWRHFDLMASVSLHDAIVAVATGTPCLHLYYEAKGNDLFDALAAQEQLFFWEHLLTPEGTERLLAATQNLLAHRETLMNRMQTARAALQERARENITHLEKLVQSLGR